MKLGVTAPRLLAQGKRVWLAWALLVGLLGGAAPVCALEVTFMTYNLYLGADLVPVINAAPAQLPAAVGAAFANVQATDFNMRAMAIADQIELKQPHFIGLQEVVQWRTGPGFDPALATNVAFDYLDILTTELSARGLSYAPVATIQNLDVELPGSLPAGPTDIRLTDRDVILARIALPAGITHANPQAQNFAAALPVTVAGTTLSVLRGWTALDVMVEGNTFRLVNTHLEVFSELVQLAQLNELLTGPGNTPLPLVLIGDLNSAASPPALVPEATYSALLAAGFTDAGVLGGIGNAPTCCQDENLLNAVSALATRIDLVAFRDAFNVFSADVVGESQADRASAGGLWPSDHAARRGGGFADHHA